MSRNRLCLHNLSSALIRSSRGAAVWGNHERKMAERLPIGLLTQLSSISVFDSFARMITTRGNVRGFQARRSSAHKIPVRSGCSNTLAPVGVRSSWTTGSDRLRSSSSRERNSLGAASAYPGQITVVRTELVAREGRQEAPDEIGDVRRYVDAKSVLKQRIPVNRQHDQRFADAGPGVRSSALATCRRDLLPTADLPGGPAPDRALTERSWQCPENG